MNRLVKISSICVISISSLSPYALAQTTSDSTVPPNQRQVNFKFSFDNIPPMSTGMQTDAADVKAISASMGVELNPDCFNYVAGTKATDAFCLGDVEALKPNISGYSSLADLTPQALNLLSRQNILNDSLDKWGFLSDKSTTIEVLVNAFEKQQPGFKQLPLSSSPVFVAVAQRFGLSDSQTFQQALQYAEFAKAPLSTLVDLKDYKVSDMKQFSTTAFKQYANYRGWKLSKIKGMDKVENVISYFAVPMQVDLPWSAAEQGDPMAQETLYIAGRAASNGKTQVKDCPDNSPCPYIELKNVNLSSLSGVTPFFYPDGSRFQVSTFNFALRGTAAGTAKGMVTGTDGGYGPLKAIAAIFGNLEFKGRNMSRFAKLVVSDCNESTGSCQLSVALPKACMKYPPPTFTRWTCTGMTILLKGVLGEVKEGDVVLIPTG